MQKLKNTITLIICVCTFLFALITESHAQVWEEITPVLSDNKPLDSWPRIAFTDGNIGWMSTASSYGYRIYRTVDGGRYWKLIKEGQSDTIPKGIAAIGSSHAWFLSRFASMLMTKDAGLTWERVAITTNGELTSSFNGPYFTNIQRGMVFCTTPWLTSDGGYSWYQGDTAKIYDPNDGFFFNEKYGWIVSNWGPFGSDAGYISRTTDRGFSWQYQVERAAFMWGIYFITQELGFALGSHPFGGGGILYKTTDSGENWNTERLPGGMRVAKIGFINIHYGWIIGGNVINATIDSGKTWNVQHRIDSTFEFTKLITIPSDNIVYAIAERTNNRTIKICRLDFTKLPVNQIENRDKFEIGIELESIYPNPSNEDIFVKFKVLFKERVVVNIYDVLGNKIADLLDEELIPETYSYRWNLNQIINRDVSVGMYYIVIRTKQGSIRKNIILSQLQFHHIARH